MTFEETMAYIHATEWTGSRPGLSRITALCHALGDPQEKLRCIHVAGTNGKGSFCAMTDAILRAAGYRVGLFTSPYIYCFGERMCLDGVPISDDELTELIGFIRPYADAMEDKPTEFELITALAFLFFARHKVDYVVLEVGMGGRLDATNIITHPILTVVTGIDLDHTAYLGDTVEKIAAEKAGIFKPGAPALCGEVSPSVLSVLREAAAARGATLTALDTSSLRASSLTKEGAVFDFEEWAAIRIPFAAAYQPKNAALVLRAVGLLREARLTLPDEAIREGLAGVSWRGRFEYLSRTPDVIFDGSHNPQGIRAAADSIRALYRDKVFLLTGVMRDKDYRRMADVLAPLTARVFTVKPENARALPAEALAEVYAELGVPAAAYPSIPGAMSAARRAAEAVGAPLFILGSLYLYREIRDAMEVPAEKPERAATV